MNLKFLSRLNFAVLIILLGQSCSGQKKDTSEFKHLDKPNIIFFLVDDMGWMDSSVYGSEYYETPNIERLSKMGVRFTRAYTANPLCSPTRASILSGQDPARFHLTTPSGHMAPNPDQDLRATKGPGWEKVATPGSRHFMPLEEFTIAEALKSNGYTTAHIGKWHLGHEDYWPEHQGFDINIGGANEPGPPSYFSPYHIINLPDKKDKEYITDRITDEALKFIENHKDKPFFLNFWQFAVHAPYQAPLKLIDKYENKKDPRGKQKSPIMAAMIEKMDESLGRMLDKLEELKLMDNTVIIFYSDNGGNMYDVVNGGFPTNNYPLSFGKGNIHEGGNRVPCIVVWKDKIKPNTISNEMIQSMDFYPTILEATHTKKNPNQLLDGLSLMGVLTKNKKLNREAIYSHFPHYIPATGNIPSSAMWYKNFKLIKEYGEGDDRSDAYKLYDLKNDISEKFNVADKYPGIVKKMSKMLDNYVKNIGGLLPIKNPNYNPKAKSKLGIPHKFPIEKYPSY